MIDNKYFKYLPSFGSYRKKIKKQTDQTDFITNTYIPENIFAIESIKNLNPNCLNVLEIGCGSGDTAVHFAELNPDCFYIASDVYLDGLISASKKMIDKNITNIKFWQQDARLLLENASYLDYIFLFFPDPWPKNKHHKKRILNVEFLELAKKALKPSGKILTGTDHPSYKKHIETLAKTQTLFSINQINAPEWWVETSYQAKAKNAGRGSYFFEITLSLK